MKVGHEMHTTESGVSYSPHAIYWTFKSWHNI